MITWRCNLHLFNFFSVVVSRCLDANSIIAKSSLPCKDGVHVTPGAFCMVIPNGSVSAQRRLTSVFVANFS